MAGVCCSRDIECGCSPLTMKHKGSGDVCLGASRYWVEGVFSICVRVPQMRACSCCGMMALNIADVQRQCWPSPTVSANSGARAASRVSEGERQIRGRAESDAAYLGDRSSTNWLCCCQRALLVETSACPRPLAHNLSHSDALLRDK